MILVGIVVSMLLNFVSPGTNHNYLYDVFISIFITIIIWEGNLTIDKILNLKFPWEDRIIRRILFQLPLSIIFSVLGIYLPLIFYSEFICNMPDGKKATMMATSITIGVLVSIIILSIEIGSQFFTHWKKSLVEIEKYKTETLQAQLQNLKNQINPHFLFNNLSVLSSLVYKDQDKALDFINQLSKVYRYLLDNGNNELVTLENEMAFIYSYTYLLKIRFDKNIIFNIIIPDDKLNVLIPPMAVQMLVENAIKHNEISSEFPLTIIIKTNEHTLEVSNNLRLRNDVETSSKTGLQNIKERYKYYTENLVEVSQNPDSFIVKIPLLKKRQIIYT